MLLLMQILRFSEYSLIEAHHELYYISGKRPSYGPSSNAVRLRGVKIRFKGTRTKTI